VKILATLLVLFSSVSAFAGMGNINVINCTDANGRVFTVDKITGATGGTPGSYIAIILVEGRMSGFPQIVTKEGMDITYPTVFKGPGIFAVIPSIQTMDLPATQARGTVQLNGDTEPVSMLCIKGPAYRM
jgi:hypothetical protein